MCGNLKHEADAFLSEHWPWPVLHKQRGLGIFFLPFGQTYFTKSTEI